MKQFYKDWNPRNTTLDVIRNANLTINEYLSLGYSLTLRQLYYQFIGRDLFPDDFYVRVGNSITKNHQKNYNKLGDYVNRGRLAGLINWDAIVDRTRNIEQVSMWSSIQSILRSAHSSFRLNPWHDQGYYVECWIEKEALAGVIEGVCDRYRIIHFSCRGYNSQSEAHEAAKRMIEQQDRGKYPIILHLGDHDPSGINMTEDIINRFEMFECGLHGSDFEVKRLALNMDQVVRYSLPPNFAKQTDSRSSQYQDIYGEESWELDALGPEIISDLIEQEILSLIDEDAWNATIQEEQDEKDRLDEVIREWEEDHE